MFCVITGKQELCFELTLICVVNYKVVNFKSRVKINNICKKQEDYFTA